MRQAGTQSIDPMHYAPAAAFVMLNGDGHVETIHRLLAGAIEGADHGYDASDTTLVNAMWSLALVGWLCVRAERWETFLTLMNRLSPQPPALLALNIDMFADPVRTGTAALPRLDAALQAVHREVDPHVIENVTASAMYADRLAEFREPLWRTVQRGARRPSQETDNRSGEPVLRRLLHRRLGRSRGARGRRAQGQRGTGRPLLRLVLPVPAGAAGRGSGPVRHEPGAGQSGHRLGRAARCPGGAGLDVARAGARRPRPG